MTSATSARLKARRSATCSPRGSVTTSRCPRSSVKAVPERGAISGSARSPHRGQEGTEPVAVHLAPAELRGRARIAEIGEHRVGCSGERGIARHDRRAHLVIKPVAPERGELRLQIEDQRRLVEAAGRAARCWMKPNDEIAMPPEAEGKPGAGRMLADLG